MRPAYQPSCEGLRGTGTDNIKERVSRVLLCNVVVELPGLRLLGDDAGEDRNPELLGLDRWGHELPGPLRGHHQELLALQRNLVRLCPRRQTRERRRTRRAGVFCVLGGRGARDEAQGEEIKIMHVRTVHLLRSHGTKKRLTLAG